MIAYKAMNRHRMCRDKKYEVGRTYTIRSKPQICVKGFHACIKMDDVFNYYPVGSIVCLVEILGDVDELGDKLATDKIKIVRVLSDLEIQEGIVSSNHAYGYCLNVCDVHLAWNKITDSFYAYQYCAHIKDRKVIRDRITESVHALEYCLYVKNRKEVRDRITDPRIKEQYAELKRLSRKYKKEKACK